MPTVTNVSRRLIHAGETMLIPGRPVDLPADVLKSAGIKALMEAGDIKQGAVEVKPEVEQDAPAAAAPATARPAPAAAKP